MEAEHARPVTILVRESRSEAASQGVRSRGVQGSCSTRWSTAPATAGSIEGRQITLPLVARLRLKQQARGRRQSARCQSCRMWRHLVQRTSLLGGGGY